MEALTANQILCLFRDGLLSGEGLINEYNMINYKVVWENNNIESMEVYNDFVEAVQRVVGIPAQVNTEELLETSCDGQAWDAVEYLRMITQQNQLGAGPSTQQQEAGPSSSTQMTFNGINIIGESNTKFIKKFNTTCKSLRFKFNDETCKENPLTWLQYKKYIEDYYNKEGIQLEAPNFGYNGQKSGKMQWCAGVLNFLKLGFHSFHNPNNIPSTGRCTIFMIHELCTTSLVSRCLANITIAQLLKFTHV